MRRRFFLGILASPIIIAAGVFLVLRRTPEEPLASDPDMDKFAYADGWIIQVKQ